MYAEPDLLREASKHHSVFTYADARRHGFSEKAIRHRRETGRWIALHRGVYVAAGVPIGWEQRVVAATVACGRSAVASFLAAGVVWEHLQALDVPHVSVPAARAPTRNGIVVHRTEHLDATTFRGFRVTHPMRTLVDLAAVIPDETLERFLDAAVRARRIDIERFATFLQLPHHLTRPGTASLRAMVGVRDPSAPLASDLETLFLRAIRSAGLPPPVPQHPVRTRRGVAYIDFAYPDAKLAIELDGWTDHGTPAAFGNDRARQNELEELGWRFRRFIWGHVRDDPDGVAFTVGRGLELRPVRWG